MDSNKPHSDIQNAVLDKITQGVVSMRPRRYFVLQSLVLLGIAGGILTLSIFIVSFVHFQLAVNGHYALLSFGYRGFFALLSVVPWLLVAVDLVLLAVFEALIRHFKFGYRRSVLYLFIVCLILAGVAGLSLEEVTGYQHHLYEASEKNALPPFIEETYKGAYQKPPEASGLFRGVVEDVQPASFTMSHNDLDNDEDDGSWTVSLEEGIALPLLSVGDRVYVAGTRTNDTIEAYGIQVLP